MKKILKNLDQMISKKTLKKKIKMRNKLILMKIRILKKKNSKKVISQMMTGKKKEKRQMKMIGNLKKMRKSKLKKKKKKKNLKFHHQNWKRVTKKIILMVLFSLINQIPIKRIKESVLSYKEKSLIKKSIVTSIKEKEIRREVRLTSKI